MVYCNISTQLQKIIEKDAESGKHIMDAEKAQQYFDNVSRVMGIELNENLRSKDIITKKYTVPLSKIIQDYRKEKYD